MRFKDCMICWQPREIADQRASREAPPGSVRVGPHPDRSGWSEAYQMSAGGAYLCSKKWTACRAALQVMLDFNTLVVRDGIDPEAAHKEFLKIDEYRFHISADTPGAEAWPDWYIELVQSEKTWRRKDDDASCD
jgi:hypothetical protein